ncbi:MAG: flavodoxin-dependent (E)-4-hydroxy-3-methylbut-2-enyl-diphosphate synthase [Coriobacteriales bacterium]
MTHCTHLSHQPSARQLTRPVRVGDVTIGGGAPVVVQSMTNLPMVDGRQGPALDVEGNLQQIARLAEAGCELVRVAIPNRASIEGFGRVCDQSPLPVIADVHFDHVIAIGAAQKGAAALRINPGNIGAQDRVDAVIDAAGEAGIPIRIGVNAGSLEDAIAERSDLMQPQKLALSAAGFVEHFHERGFDDIVISAKSHDVMTTVAAYRQLSRELPQVPLHIGVTEAGTVQQGTIKSAAGLGILLAEGIGDTLRVSLTADPVEEIPVAYGILAAVDVRRVQPELISCPTCSRCQVDMIPIATEVGRRLQGIRKPLKVAVMGCVVNGPGEARDADCGVACGRESGMLFVHGEPLRKVPAAEIVDELFALIEKL